MPSLSQVEVLYSMHVNMGHGRAVWRHARRGYYMVVICVSVPSGASDLRSLGPMHATRCNGRSCVRFYCNIMIIKHACMFIGQLQTFGKVVVHVPCKL